MNKIILYYKYIHIPYPKQIMKWQKNVCCDLNLKGRILISHEGINGTVGGTLHAIQLYKKSMSEHELFDGIDFKESNGGPECFPRMSIKVRPEAVSLGIPYDTLTTRNTGVHLSVQQTHELIMQKPHDLIIFDARNSYESRIGKFTNAITPDITNFRELPDYIDRNLEQFKDKQVLMYCTGGIRCERASAYLKEKEVAKEVYQIEGGIHRYVEQYPDGFFRGKNYVFDNRIAVTVNNDILSTCEQCNRAYDEYSNCLNAMCNKKFIACKLCIQQLADCCSITCKTLVAEKKVHTRPPFTKIQIHDKEYAHN